LGGTSITKSGELALAIEINFGKDLIANRRPEASIWLDGADTFRAATAKGYVDGVEQAYFADQIARGRPLTLQSPPVVIDTRFRYNQAFESVNAIVPGVIMLLLVLIPAMMTAVGVVPEKETGSIANFQSTPITKLEFLLGKQAPCVAIALVGFVAMLLLAVFLFRVPVRGSIATLFLGVGAYLCATTGFGLLISSFTKTQVGRLWHSDPYDPARPGFLRASDSCLVAPGKRPRHRSWISGGMVPADQRRDNHEGPRHCRSLARHSGARRICRGFHRRRRARAAQARGVTWACGGAISSGWEPRSCAACAPTLFCCF
jgi:hypothetical protein